MRDGEYMRKGSPHAYVTSSVWQTEVMMLPSTEPTRLAGSRLLMSFSMRTTISPSAPNATREPRPSSGRATMPEAA